MNKKSWLLIGISSVLVISLAVVFVVAPKISDDNLPLYTVNFDTKGGTEIPSVQVKEGKKLEKPTDPSKKGYHVKNWTYKDNAWLFDEDVVKSDMTLVTGWEYDRYVITYDFAGGSYEGEYKTTYDIDTSFTLIRPEKNGSVFGGWFDQNGNRIDEIIKGMTGNITITAKWLDDLVIDNTDKTKGKVLSYIDKDDTNKITIEFVPENHKYHLFDGWYNDADVLLSNEISYTFSLNKQKTTYIAAKYISDENETVWNKNHGVVPSFDHENSKALYGMYPQNNVNDTNLISRLEKAKPCDFNNYYYYGSEYYFKKQADLYYDDDEQIHNFDNGTEIIHGEYYWFKVEPISWKILKKESSNCLMMTEKLIDVVEYYNNSATRIIDDKKIYPNNYKYSDLRKWLNEDFLTSAFCFDNKYLVETEVNNGTSTTISIENPFVCENTFDYVFELSYQDYLNEDYGFTSNEARTFLTTDLSRTSNALYGTSDKDLYCGYKWTRSPFYSNNDNEGVNISRISRDGVINTCWCGAGYSCTQPCIKMNIFNVL